MKVRIFALAKELEMDSKELIDVCREAGIEIKNSALASISEEERDKVVQHIQDSRSEQTSASSAAADKLAPVRDVTSAQKLAKVPQIKSATPPKIERPSSPSPSVDETDSQTDAPTEAPAQPPIARPRDLAAEQNMVPVERGPMTSGGTKRPAKGPLAGLRAGKDAEPKDEEAEPPPAETPTEATAEPPAAISRDDYIPPAGHGSKGLKTVAPMTPIGSGNSADAPERTDKSPRGRKPRQSRQLPSLAAPQMAPPPVTPPKHEEAPAQKPDIRLPSDVISQSRPLHEYVKQHAEDKKKKKKGVVETNEQAKTDRRGGKRGAGLIESRDSRQQRRKRRGVRDDDQAGDRHRRRSGTRRKKASGPALPLKTSAKIEFPITIRSLSEAIGRPAKTLMTMMFQRGEPLTINANLDEETAIELSMECGVDLEVRHERDIEQELVEKLTGDVEDPEAQTSRPPIVTILGHVDHGKTTLLDTIRSANVAGGEAGGITQHIASYQVEHEGQKITFVDTPGHAAFGEMRARGANVTDIVVLVVAADDGVMPQTKEAISHAKAAEVPIIVAMNKTDLVGVDQQRVLQELSTQEVLPAEWGGDFEVIRTSALSGDGIDELLHTILLTAELHEYQGNPDVPAFGVCLEAFRDEGRGVLTWLIVQQGTLRIGDDMLCGPAFGRIRAIYDDQDNELTEAPPSTPVKVSGLDIVPGAGDHFFVMADIDEAREAAESRRHRGRAESLAGRGRPRTLEDILNQAKTGDVQDLPLIIKADTPGSAEALRSELEKLDHPEVRVEIVHEGVGGVNESDVTLASATGAIIVAFHVVPEDRAEALADREGVEIRRYSIIYEVTDDIKAALEGLLRPELRDVPTGRVLVLKTFSISRYGTIAGCRVLNGTIDRNNRMHVIRDQTVLNNYKIASLKREKDDVKEVREGMECGIRLEGFNDIKEGDLLEAYRVEEVKRTLESATASS